MVVKLTCTGCGKDFYVGGFPRYTSDPRPVFVNREELGKRMAELATQAITPAYCGTEACKRIEADRWETDGGR